MANNLPNRGEKMKVFNLETYLKKSIFGYILLALLLVLSLNINVPLIAAQGVIESLNETETGVFAKGQLSYVRGSNVLGSESYQLVKRNSGEIVLISEGKVSPPIPIPFVNPKIKFNQEIRIDETLSPRSLNLDIDGILGIGSKEVQAKVRNGRIDAGLGGEQREARLQGPGNSFFQGTGSSWALTTLILVMQNDIDEIVEIRIGGISMQRGDDERLKTQLHLKSQETQEMKINGTTKLVDRYVLEGSQSDVNEVILADGGTFIAYLKIGGEKPFYVYRSDLLGDDYKFSQS